MCDSEVPTGLLDGEIMFEISRECRELAGAREFYKYKIIPGLPVDYQTFFVHLEGIPTISALIQVEPYLHLSMGHLSVWHN